MKHTGFLVVGAGGDMRVIRRWPNNLRNDEVMFRLTVNVPEGWGTVRGSIEVTMPEPPDKATLELVETSAGNAASPLGSAALSGGTTPGQSQAAPAAPVPTPPQGR